MSVQVVMPALPSESPVGKLAPEGALSKETRKLRKKKQLSDDGDSSEEGQEQEQEQGREDEDSVDGMDTDDLLDLADKVPPLRTRLSKRLTKSKGRRGPSIKRKKRKPKKEPPVYQPERVRELRDKYPDVFWKFHADSSHGGMIDSINADHPLAVLPYHVSDQAPITGMALSSDGTLLATFSNVGAVKIWDVDQEFTLIRKLRDMSEKNIDEYYCGQFASETQGLLAVGGKLKDRYRWSTEDDDSHILPCPIKLFDIEAHTVVAKLEGHAEEILCIKSIQFMDKNYFVSTSQDGYIIKWHMDSDWTSLLDSTKMDDGVTCMAFTVSFLPNTGNKYFLAACDGHLRLYDFEEAQLMQTFEDMYSSYCDCGKFIKWVDEDMFRQEQEEEIIEVVEEEVDYAWFISRGAEMCDVSDGVSSIPNTCTLHKLIYPSQVGGEFKLEEVKRYQHEDYHANSWLVKVTSNGRYILAPTIYGQVFVFNMLTGRLSAILKDHEDLEVRDILFHPYRPLVFTSGDDGSVKVYTLQELVMDTPPALPNASEETEHPSTA